MKKILSEQQSQHNRQVVAGSICNIGNFDAVIIPRPK